MRRHKQALSAPITHKWHCHLIAHMEHVLAMEILVGVVKKKSQGLENHESR